MKEIGEILLSSGVEFPIERVKSKEELLAKVIFDVDSGVLDCDCNIKCDGERAKEFLWVGNAIGKKPQIMLTTDNPKYLLDPSNPDKWAIGRIISEIDKRRLTDKDVVKLRCILNEVAEKLFPGRKRAYDPKDFLAQKGCADDIALYTACVRKDGKVIELVKEPGYQKFLLFMLYEAESEEYPAMRGICHICGEDKEVLTNPSYPEGSLLCIYNVDKAGFMSELSRKPESLLKTHAICPECKKKLVLGLKFVEQNLTATIGEASPAKLRIFIIPRIMGTKLSYETLQEIAQKMQSAFNVVKAYRNLEEVEQFVDKFIKTESYSSPPTCFLNLLFGHRKSSHFSFQYLIQDVPVMRLLDLARSSSRISEVAADLFSESIERWSIGFEGIFSVFPLKIREGGNVVDWKPLVELFNSMLTGTAYPEESIISRAVLFARINRYETYKGYNMKPPKDGEEQLCRGILKYNLLLRFLREVGVIEVNVEPESKAYPYRVSDKDIESFLSKMGYAEWQKALFLLGVLIGKIGIEQYKKGDKKKAVLGKINFEGMSAERVKILANHTLEALRNYGILSYNEVLYAYMKMMLDRNLGALHNPIENVFYILSGYAYVTLHTITSGGEGENEGGSSEQ
ncbi:MAG: type I-B CRISPR-associated protein Cas8b/Csh1 [Nitrososphaerota archaeon]